MKNQPLLLLLTDLSAASRSAYGPALELAERLGGRIELLHVAREVEPALYAPPAVAPVTPISTQELVASAEETLERERDRLAEGASTAVPVAVQVLAGDDVPRTVVEHARERGAELIVLATHGRTGLRRVLLGSVAEDVLRASDVPLVVVPARTADEDS